MVNKTLVRILVENNLKVTPQRIAVLEVMLNLNNHPTADEVVDYLRINYPHISIGTVYKNLDAFSEKGIINKVKTANDIMRYDAVRQKHHHIYYSDSESIEDYYDDDLNKILEEYFKKKSISKFIIEDIKVQIIGKSTDKK